MGDGQRGRVAAQGVWTVQLLVPGLTTWYGQRRWQKAEQQRRVPVLPRKVAAMKTVVGASAACHGTGQPGSRVGQ